MYEHAHTGARTHGSTHVHTGAEEARQHIDGTLLCMARITLLCTARIVLLGFLGDGPVRGGLGCGILEG